MSQPYDRTIERLQSDNDALCKERDELREAIGLIRIKLGIRDDFCPLGAALELEPIIRKALAKEM